MFWSSDVYQQIKQALWKALREIYGSEESALAAVRQNSAVMSPIYATPDLLRRSALLLRQLLGEAEAETVFRDNPAVLTCGEVKKNKTKSRTKKEQRQKKQS